MTQGTLIEVEAAPRQDRDSDHWFTPMKLFEQLHKKHQFTLDAAGHGRAPVTKAIGAFCDVETNGLTKSWAGQRVWCNPPYSDITPWVRRVWDEFHEMSPTAPELVVQLLPAWTDRKWWQQWVEPYRDRHGGLLRTSFLTRQKFGTPEDPHGAESDQASFMSVLLFWGRP